MNRFKELFDQYDWETEKKSILKKSFRDVESALRISKRSLEDFKALLSPAARPYLEEIAQQSQVLTQQRFGKTIQLFAPMYLSNECNNICTYCGFSLEHQIKRKTLQPNEIIQEAMAIKDLGFDHILLVSGESAHRVNLDYFLKAIELIQPYFSNISMEVQPLEEDEYTQLHHHGIFGILVYQETYHKERYHVYHLKGKKANFYNRLDAPDRIGQSGMHKIGLGVLLGMEDWRTDSFFCALHLDYLQKTYWKSKYSISFPRLRPAEGVDISGMFIEDQELVQLICAFRLWNPDIEISISTREKQVFRDHLMLLGTTSMSAGSKTNPGGYSIDFSSLEQFEISDERSPQEVANMIINNGYDPVWKDWEKRW
ncbi:MAG: 2-iminoacetate synthase ThiH [Chitinophagaceae bacterium]